MGCGNINFSIALHLNEACGLEAIAYKNKLEKKSTTNQTKTQNKIKTGGKKTTLDAAQKIMDAELYRPSLKLNSNLKAQPLTSFNSG